jgi:hypothetical protein
MSPVQSPGKTHKATKTVTYYMEAQLMTSFSMDKDQLIAERHRVMDRESRARGANDNAKFQ